MKNYYSTKSCLVYFTCRNAELSFLKTKQTIRPPPPFLSIIIFIPTPLLEFSLELFLKKPLFLIIARKKNETSSYIYIGVIFLFLIFKKITNLIHFSPPQILALQCSGQYFAFFKFRDKMRRKKLSRQKSSPLQFYCFITVTIMNMK